METFSASEKSIRAVRTDPILAANYDMRATLPILCKQIPCAFIWGENDVFAVPEIGRQVEKMLPDAAFHWLQGAGHQVQTDQPELVAEIVDQLIRKTSDRIPAPA
jgi:pimeloyl-ACP methyl ester carboxylesterase